MSLRKRIAAATLATAVAAVATTGPASAQEAETFYIGADATVASLTVLGTDVGTFGHATSIAEHTPSVVTEATAFFNDAVSVSQTSSRAAANGDEAHVPAGDGALCELPGLPAELNGVLGAVEVCSSSFSALSASGTPAGLGAADAGQLALNGKALADLIFDLLLPTILEQLSAITDPVDENVIGPVDAALQSICDGIPAELNPIQVVDAAADAGLPVGDVIAALPNGNEIVAQLDNDCLLALATMVDLTGVLVETAEAAVREAILDALDRDLLTITLGASTSSILEEGGVNIARSEVEALTISTASLEFLLDVVDAIVAGTLQGVIDDVTAIVPTELDAAVAAIPDLGDVLDQILALLDLGALIDDQPLLEVSVAASAAEAKAPLAEDGSSVDTSGSTVGAIIVRLSPAIAGFLGIDAETTLAPGVDQVIAEGTPLESSIKVGQIEQLTETLGSGSVATTGVRAVGAEIALLTSVEELNGGIVLAVADSSARLGGTAPVSALPDTPTLPTTGSTDVILLLGALGLTAAWIATRRLQAAQG